MINNVRYITTSKKFRDKCSKDFHNFKIIYGLYKSGKIKELPKREEPKKCSIIIVNFEIDNISEI